MKTRRLIPFVGLSDRADRSLYMSLKYGIKTY